jgi:hypothetical protein
LTTGNPILFIRFDDWQPNKLATQLPILSSSCHLNKQKIQIKNLTVKSLKCNRRPNSQEKRLPKLLGAWKTAFIFYIKKLKLFELDRAQKHIENT